MNFPKHMCKWVYHPATPDREAVYCGRTCAYVVALDDDSNRVRKYHNFCEQHLAEIRRHPDSCEEELSDD